MSVEPFFNTMIQEKTPLVPFARSARELPRPGRRAFFHIWNAAALLLSSAGITVLSLMLGLGMFDIEFFFDYFRHPLIFLLNWVPVLLLQLAPRLPQAPSRPEPFSATATSRSNMPVSIPDFCTDRSQPTGPRRSLPSVSLSFPIMSPMTLCVSR